MNRGKPIVMSNNLILIHNDKISFKKCNSQAEESDLKKLFFEL